MYLLSMSYTVLTARVRVVALRRVPVSFALKHRVNRSEQAGFELGIVHFINNTSS